MQTTVKTVSMQLSWQIHHKPIPLFHVPYRQRKMAWFANLCPSPSITPVSE